MRRVLWVGGLIGVLSFGVAPARADIVYQNPPILAGQKAAIFWSTRRAVVPRSFMPLKNLPLVVRRRFRRSGSPRCCKGLAMAARRTGPPAAPPSPASLVLMATGVLGLTLRRRRKG